MNRTAALARLGLSGDEDATTLARAYGEQLSTAQQNLITAGTDQERAHHQAVLSALVEAYECLTYSGRYTQVRENEPAPTMARESVSAQPAPDTRIRMETGSVLSGRLEIGELLGQGGMGYVYAARDRLRNEDVAIKVLRQDLVSSTSAKERFLSEARVSSSLSHPNIVRVYDVGEAGEHYYLSMERLKGQTLRQRIEEHRRSGRDFSIAEVTDIARQLMDALRYAHRYIVHRDLKPENIWLSEDGTIKLMDFGIARVYSNSQLTQTGMTLGTAYYMAPEQRLDAKEVDWRADQYALGVVMYELLTGSIPMGAVRPIASVRRDVPSRFAQAVMRAMSPKPEDRWPSLNEWLAELEAPERSGSKAAAWIALGVGLLAAAGAAAYFVTMQQSDPVVAEAPAAFLQPESPATNASGSSESQPPAPPPVASPSAAALPPVVEAEPAPAAQVASEPPPAVVQSKPVAASAMKVAVIEDPAQTRRQECIAQCERSDGECRSMNRRGKQECLRAVGFGATGGFTAAPGVNSASADCAFYGQARCEYARDRSACLARTSARYNECVTSLSGNVASRRQDCDITAREADRMCLDQLQDCRSYCE